MDDVSGSSQNRTVVYENAENWVFTPALFDAVLSEENLKRDYSQNVFRSLLTGMGKGLTQERVKRILSIGVNSTDEKVKRCCLYLIHEASQSDEQRDCIKQLFSNVQNARQLKNLMQVTPHSSFEQLYHISSLVGSAYYRIDSNSSCPMDEWIGSVSFIGISGWVTDGPLLTKEQLTRLMSSVEMLSQIEDHSDYQRLMFTDRLVALACQMMRCLETYDTGLLHRFLTICQDKRAMGVWRQYTVNEIIKWPDAIKHLHFANPEIYSARTVDLFLELLKPGTVSHRFVLEVLSDFVSMFSKEQLDRLYLIVKGEGSFPDNLEAMALNICVRVHYALAHRAPQKGVLHATASSLTSDELKFVLEKIPLLGEDEIKKLVSWLIAVIRISDLDVTEEHKVLVDRIYQVDQALFKACPDLFILQAQIHTLK